MCIRRISFSLSIALVFISLSVARAETLTATLNLSVVIMEPKLDSVLFQLDDRAKLVRLVNLLRAHMLDTGEELNWQAGNGSGQMVVTGKTIQNGASCSTVSERIVTGSRSVTYHSLACG